MQNKTLTAYKALVTMVTERKDYTKFLSSIQRVRDGVGDDGFYELVNYKDDNGKTLIHHIIENPESGYRPGLWAIVELRLKGADINIPDKLGNTALHSCAALYSHIISHFMDSYTKEAKYVTDLHASNLGSKERRIDELTMFANMADIGALLLLGANPNLRNKCNQTVWDIMGTTAGKIQAGAIRPQLNEESCKKAFSAFFDREKRRFSPNPVIENEVEYPWAPNVVNWVAGLKLPSATAATRTGSSSDDDCCIPSPKVTKAADHVALVASRTAATAGKDEGCTLF